ncbi:hypothetical protein [Azospirillum argentinense]|uniref:Uncharacterized protein n=1 Tax=Azospirillum argentinense TaxID=2970906 RepID=A0A5B0KLS7_9PROT|nr:hypothetical protein [Azospirillum argentinense]KAA1053542.1 hypothetical protein FH063_002853 [Azospirillum argentinense]
MSSRNNKFIVRFAVFDGNGARSLVWRLWVDKNDIYLSSRNMSNIVKTSFHYDSKICRYAKTNVDGNAREAFVRWIRAPLSDSGKDGGVLLARISIPSDYLSSSLSGEPPVDVIKVPGASAGQSTFIEIFLTKENLARVDTIFPGTNSYLIARRKLLNGVIMGIKYGYGDYDFKGIEAPKSNADGSVFGNLSFPETDVWDTGRPIRMTLFQHPKDGDALEILEIGGYDPDAAVLSAIMKPPSSLPSF